MTNMIRGQKAFFNGKKSYLRFEKEWLKTKTKGKKLLTALNQAPRERFTFEYGCCSSKDGF